MLKDLLAPIKYTLDCSNIYLCIAHTFPIPFLISVEATCCHTNDRAGITMHHRRSTEQSHLKAWSKIEINVMHNFDGCMTVSSSKAEGHLIPFLIPTGVHLDRGSVVKKPRPSTLPSAAYHCHRVIKTRDGAPSSSG